MPPKLVSDVSTDDQTKKGHTSTKRSRKRPKKRHHQSSSSSSSSEDERKDEPEPRRKRARRAEKEYVCDACHQQSAQAKDDGDHFWISKTPKCACRKRVKKKTHTTGPFPCPHPGCDKVFTFRTNASRHYQSIHVRKSIPRQDEKEKLFSCLDCHRSYATTTALADHRRREHDDSRKYSCEACGYSTAIRWHLTRHKSTSLSCTMYFQVKEGTPTDTHWFTPDRFACPCGFESYSSFAKWWHMQGCKVTEQSKQTAAAQAMVLSSQPWLGEQLDSDVDIFDGTVPSLPSMTGLKNRDLHRLQKAIIGSATLSAP